MRLSLMVVAFSGRNQTFGTTDRHARLHAVQRNGGSSTGAVSDWYMR